MFGGQPGKSSFSFGAPSTQSSSSSTLPFSFANTAPKTSSPLFNSFGASSTTGTGTSVAATNDMAVESTADDDDNVDEVLYLDPPAYTRADKAKWKASGRAFLAAASPVNGEVVGWTTKQPSSDPNKPAELADPKLSVADRVAYVASINNFAPAEQTLYAETHTLFVSLQQIVASSMRLPDNDNIDMWDPNGGMMEGLLGPPNAETIVHMNRLVSMYLEEVNKLRVAEDLDDEKRERYDSVFHIFNLAQILYLPRDGRGESLLGEELLDWVNAVDTVQINAQGNEIMAANDPWNQESFFPFIVRCLLRGFFLAAASFLRTLSTHPHPPIAKLGQLLAKSVTGFPRSTNINEFPLDHQFISAHKQWLAQFRADLVTFEGGRGRGHWFDTEGSSGRSEWASWEEDFRSVTELLEGKPERLFQEVSDWREAIGAWGVLVDVGLRQDDLPRVVERVLNELPIDSTILEDSIQSSLCSGDIIKALMDSHSLDRWLAAHLGDVFDKLALIPDDEERFDTSLRDYYLLDYADMLQESPSQVDLWRVICEYLAAAGDDGRNRLREYVVHVGVLLGHNKSKGKDKEANGDMDVEDDDDEAISQLQRFTELREVCTEFKLEDEWRTISKTVSEMLIRRGELGIAASICLASEDGFLLSRIAEKILTAFVDSGDDEFLRLVNSLPESMLHEAPQKFSELHLGGIDTELTETTMVMFASRLAFLSEFRDYLLYLTQGSRDLAAKKLINLLTSGITPVEFWGVLLAESVDLLEDRDIYFNSAETFELMRVLEEVLSNAKYAPVEYLRQLSRYLARHDEEAKETKEADGRANGTLNGVNGNSSSNGASKNDSSNSDKPKKDTVDIEAAERKLEVVRLALARNLSRALVVGCDGPF